MTNGAGADDSSLYATRTKVYPREVRGRFQTLRTLSVFALLGLYYIVPWLLWDGRQAILFDLPARKFYLLSLVLWPQDFIYLTALLILAALALFLFTAVAGRLWCGYACPQTVWTEVFIWMERWIEGSRSRQQKLDRAPWSLSKFRLKASKHAAWIAFSLWTGFTFVGYFTPIRELAAKVLSFGLGPWELFWILFYSFATYGNAGWMREQVCIYMCPYARFQSAMFDRNTLIVSFDENRGEPRGSRRRNVKPTPGELGDCIDCTLCVQVCPTGIDIRDGLQYQCIGCAACIDACDDVMQKMNYPPGLIRYTSEAALQEGSATRLLRPRTFVYASVMLVLVGAMLYSIHNRALFEIDVIRDRNALYRMADDGEVENVYTVNLMNKDTRDHRVTIDISGTHEMRLLGDAESYELPAGEVLNVPLRVRIPPTAMTSRSIDIGFAIHSIDKQLNSKVEHARFLGPG